MDPSTHKCTVSRDVVFDEISSYYIKDAEENGQTNLPISMSTGSSSSRDYGDRGSLDLSRDTSVDERAESQSLQGSPHQEESSLQQNGESRPKRNIVRPCRFRDDNFVTTFSCFLANAVDDEEPASYNEAKCVKEWVTAMEEEMHALEKNETWDVVPKPPGTQAVTCKWVYRIKRKADGSIDRYKARLVARGFSQKYGEDYEETFSPVAKMTSIRTVLALAASSRWKLWQLDVKNAFLYGELDRPIYMEQPPGFEKKDGHQLVCRLKKALYGLKQAPRAWYGKIAEYLQFCGYTASESDSSLFIKKHQGQMVVVLLYVDDIILTGSNYGEVTRLQDELSLRFEMKKLGELGTFLGLQIENLEEGLFVSQINYAKKLVDKFGMTDGKKSYTPLDVNPRLSRDEGTCLPDPRLYRALVGSLIYLTITRPDIAYAVGVVSRYMQEPRKPHLEEAKKILKYINTSLDVGLFYRKGAKFVLQGFADADFAGDRDDRRSTSGFVFLCGNTSISWSSRKQGSVSLSTTEAEYKASAHAAQECIWLRRLLEDLHVKFDQPVPIHGDNLSAIKLTSNPVFHARTKHIELEHHFIREKVLEGIIEMVAVRSEDNVADIFTKALPKGPFEDLRSKLGLVHRTSL